MSTLSPRRAAAGLSVLLAVSLSACGSDDSSGGGGDEPEAAPESASVEDFCAAYTGDPSDLPSDPSPEEQVQSIQDAIEELADVGTPEDMPEEAKAGFDVYLEAAADLEPEDVQALEEAAQAPDPKAASEEVLGFSEEEAAQVDALQQYGMETCVPEAPSGAPTDIPSPTQSPSPS